jgi:hypothetical protein
VNVSFAPIINGVSFRILLIAKLAWNMKAKIINIDTAFLHGNLNEEIYMEVTPGLDINKNKKLILRKTIYGIFQSFREFTRS